MDGTGGNPKPDLGIVVPCSRRGDLLRRTMSALVQSVSTAELASTSVRLVNDGPPSQALLHLVEECGFTILQSGGRGPGVARNVGAVAGGEWLLFVDDDVEVDNMTVARATELVRAWPPGRTAVIGSLRPPPDVPRWLERTYCDMSMFSATAYRPAGRVPHTQLCAALLLLRRESLAAVGGFPAISTWEDAVLGLRLAARRPGEVLRDDALTGVHWNAPIDWRAWLERQSAAGSRLAALADEVTAAEVDALLAALRVEDGLRAAVKTAASRLPEWLWRYARGPVLGRIAASAVFMRSYRATASGTRLTGSAGADPSG